MRLLVIDPHGDGLDVAVRAQRDGHEVRYFVRPHKKTEHIGQGFVHVTGDFKEWVRWADIVFAADNTVYLRDMQAARNEGHRGIIAATEETASWEINRPVGQRMFRKHGIATIPFRQFDDYDAAIRYVKKEDRRFVSKPCGDDDKDKALSYVSKSPEDMVYMLERWQRLGKLKNPFILQEFIDGCEMAVGAFFGPGGFNEGWCENWEFKKFMNNDLGVATGEQGTVVRFVKQSKLARRVLAPLAGELEKQNYIGYIDVNCIIDDQGVAWPLEFTMRPGWPTYNIQMALMKGDTAQWLLELTQGKDSRIWIYDSVAIGVVMSVPDYPYSHITQREVVGIPIYGIKPALWEHVHPCCMMMGHAPKKANGTFHDLPMPVTAGDYVLIMTALGPTVRDAANTVYRRLGNLIVPNSPMYRTDIGRRLGKQLPKLQSKGYATDMVYSLTS
jgi:phosphoribosylamine--glycine ligase